MILTVVLLKAGPHAGSIAVIAEIIDHNRVSLIRSFRELVSTPVVGHH